LIEEALLNNPEILAARQKWEAYKEKVPQAYALEDPMLSFGIISLPTNFSFRDEDMTMKEIAISQKFPFPGKRPLMKEMAEKEAEAVYAEIQGKIQQIIRDVKTAYYTFPMSTGPPRWPKGIKRSWRILPRSLRPSTLLGRGYNRMFSRPMWRSPRWWMN